MRRILGIACLALTGLAACLAIIGLIRVFFFFICSLVTAVLLLALALKLLGGWRVDGQTAVEKRRQSL